MKILFIQPYFDLDVFSDTFINQLGRRGHDVEVLCYVKDKKKASRLLKVKNIRFNFINALSFSFSRFVKEFPYFISLDQIMKNIQPDIVHINNLPFLTTLQSTRITKRMGIPSVVHVHGVIGKSSKLLDFIQYFYIKTFGQNIFRDATSFICLTQSDAIEIQSCGCPPEKIVILPNGVDVEKFKPTNKTFDNMIFWGGRFIKQKGLEYLVKALVYVVKTHCSIKLVMTGDGQLFPKIKNLVRKLGLERNVFFRGRVTRDELPLLVGTSSIYVMPSLKEGMPFALLEAMSCGRAVIASDIPGINDVITHNMNGILVPPKDPEALATAISILLEDQSLRKRLGHNARQLMIQKYDLKKISKKIEKIYYETIKNG